MSINLATCAPEQKAMIDAGYCGAKNRNAAAKTAYCGHKAGHRTDHKGIGRCWLHGGNNVIRSGRWSQVKNTRLRDMIAEYEEDPDPLNTQPEIAAARAIFQDFIERYADYSESLVAWHQSYTPGQPHDRLMTQLGYLLEHVESIHHQDELKENNTYQTCKRWHSAFLASNPKPTQILDISDAVRHVDTISKMVERVGKLNSQNAGSRKDFVRIMTEIGNIIEQSVDDDRTKLRIKSRMSQLKLA